MGVFSSLIFCLKLPLRRPAESFHKVPGQPSVKCFRQIDSSSIDQLHDGMSGRGKINAFPPDPFLVTSSVKQGDLRPMLVILFYAAVIKDDL